MATSTTQVLQNHETTNTSCTNEAINRQELQAAITKAVELRALHASLVQRNNNCGFSSPSPVSHSASASARDYPVFTPTYGDNHIHAKPRAISSNWDEFEVGGISEDQKSVTGSCTNHIAMFRASPRTELCKFSTGSCITDYNTKPAASCSRCKLASLSGNESMSFSRNVKHSTLVVPMTDSHASTLKHSSRNRGVMSWLLPKLRKKNKKESFSNQAESEEVSQILNKGFGFLSIEALMRELIEAKESRDAALLEVSEMKSSLGEIRHKLEFLESYCEELKKASKQATTSKHATIETLYTKGGISNGSDAKAGFPVIEEVMVEGFLQMVSEARLAVKQFCKTLIGQIEETDLTLIDNLNRFLQQYKLSINPKNPKAVLHHLEAIVNKSMYQDFENSVFQQSGPTSQLDPEKDREEKLSSFVSLRNLSWNEVLRKGTKYYSEGLSKFCDQKMSCIITTLNWTRPWSEQPLQAFFVAAKCIWLLHLLAFSFNPPVQILRVGENRSFDSHYMEDIFMDRQRSQVPSRVKVMITPGFYVKEKVLRSKVICRHSKSVA